MKVIEQHCWPLALAAAQVEEALQSRHSQPGGPRPPSDCVLLPVPSQSTWLLPTCQQQQPGWDLPRGTHALWERGAGSESSRTCHFQHGYCFPENTSTLCWLHRNFPHIPRVWPGSVVHSRSHSAGGMLKPLGCPSRDGSSKASR